MSKPPLSEFVISSKEGDDLRSSRTKEGFELNVHKLMEGVGYNIQN